MGATRLFDRLMTARRPRPVIESEAERGPRITRISQIQDRKTSSRITAMFILSQRSGRASWRFPAPRSSTFGFENPGAWMPVPVSALGKGLRVEWIDFCGDHTMHACLTDEAGQRTEVCIDGRKNSPTRFRLYEQGRHPNQPGAVLV